MSHPMSSGISGVYRSASIKRLITSKEKDEFRKKIEKMRERDNELVTGIFKNLENPGATIEFTFKLYAGDDYVHYELKDGERYQIPRGVAKHIANNCYIKQYKQLGNQFGGNFTNGANIQMGTHDGSLRNAPTWQIETKKHRFAFQSLEYMDDSMDFQPHDVAQVKLAI